MHGLILRTLQVFVEDTYGVPVWSRVVRQADINVTDFEGMLQYDSALLETLLGSMEKVLTAPRVAMLEDVGTFLVSHPTTEPLRRLLRFGGVDFTEFLYSLNDLSDRARLAVSDLILPDIEVRELGDQRFAILVSGDLPGFGHVMLGLLRAMADDYGVLVLMEFETALHHCETISLSVVDTDHSEGRGFALSPDVPDRTPA